MPGDDEFPDEATVAGIKEVFSVAKDFYDYGRIFTSLFEEGDSTTKVLDRIDILERTLSADLQELGRLICDQIESVKRYELSIEFAELKGHLWEATAWFKDFADTRKTEEERRARLDQAQAKCEYLLGLSAV